MDQEYESMDDLYQVESGNLAALENEHENLAQWNVDSGYFYWVDVRSKGRADTTMSPTSIALADEVEPLSAMRM